MKVLNSRSALLSEYEVLTFLREASAEEHNRPKSDRHQDSNALQNLRTVHFEVISELSKTYRPSAHQSASEITGFLDSLQHYGFTVKPSASKAKIEGNQVNGHVAEEKEGGESTGSEIPPLMDEEGNEIVLEEVAIRNRLTKLEKWMLVNLVPKSEADLYSTIEQPMDRFTETHISVLLFLLQHHFANYFSNGTEEGIAGDGEGPSNPAEDVQMAEAEAEGQGQGQGQGAQEEEIQDEGETGIVTDDPNGEYPEVEEQEFDDEVDFRNREGAVDDEEVAND